MKVRFKSFDISIFLLMIYFLIACMVIEYLLHAYFGVSLIYPRLFYLPLFVLIAGIIGILSARKKVVETELLYHILERLRLENVALEESSSVKGEFFASMSHELRTPLNTIIGYCDMIKYGFYGEISKEQTEAIDLIKNSGSSLLLLINQILDLSGLEVGKFKIEYRNVPVDEVLKDVQDSFLPLLQKKRQQIELNVETGLTVWAGELRLIQCFNNLISNAIKFSPEKTKLWLKAHKEGDVVVFSVKDEGIGIPHEVQEAIFEPFHRTDATKKIEGTGLGLHITKKLVNLMGGRIWLESELGKGSEFSFSVPISKHEKND